MEIMAIVSQEQEDLFFDIYGTSHYEHMFEIYTSDRKRRKYKKERKCRIKKYLKKNMKIYFKRKNMKNISKEKI